MDPRCVRKRYCVAVYLISHGIHIGKLLHQTVGKALQLLNILSCKSKLFEESSMKKDVKITSLLIKNSSTSDSTVLKNAKLARSKKDHCSAPQ